MIDIESKVVSYREDTNDYRLCLSREEMEDIKNCRAKTIDEMIARARKNNIYGYAIALADLEDIGERMKNEIHN